MGLVDKLADQLQGTMLVAEHRRIIKELETQLASLSWRPITPGTVLTADHEVTGWGPSGRYVYLSAVAGRAGCTAEYWLRDYTHFRPINPPAQEPK